MFLFFNYSFYGKNQNVQKDQKVQKGPAFTRGLRNNKQRQFFFFLFPRTSICGVTSKFELNWRTKRYSFSSRQVPLL